MLWMKVASALEGLSVNKLSQVYIGVISVTLFCDKPINQSVVNTEVIYHLISQLPLLHNVTT